EAAGYKRDSCQNRFDPATLRAIVLILCMAVRLIAICRRELRVEKAMHSKRITHISLVLIPEATASTLLCIYDVFSLFEKVVPGEAAYTVAIVSDVAGPLLTASNISLQAEFSYDDAPAS